jgi:hypothetical protein
MATRPTCTPSWALLLYVFLVSFAMIWLVRVPGYVDLYRSWSHFPPVLLFSWWVRSRRLSLVRLLLVHWHYLVLGQDKLKAAFDPVILPHVAVISLIC